MIQELIGGKNMKTHLIMKNPVDEAVKRPWGSYKIIEYKKHCLVKQIDVFPGEMLSLQSHSHRSEHWTVVSGVAQVQRGNETLNLEKDEALVIPKNTKHRLANKTKYPLRIIEIQYGDILDENDIVRYDDLYGRC